MCLGNWEDNIKNDLQEVGWQGMDWIDLLRDYDRWRAVMKKVCAAWS